MADSFEEGYGSKGAALSVILMIMSIYYVFEYSAVACFN
jgi:hypothetical protein